jgi:uncharacterized damage-inducible protein DinB
MSKPEVWLRGPVPDVAPQLQPPVHSFMQVVEDVEALVAGLEPARLWAAPGGSASVGYHCRHLAGSTDRLLTYARGEPLSPAQVAAMKAETGPPLPGESAATLVAAVTRAMEQAIAQVRSISVADLTASREVGRARLPTTVLGLVFHAAEHATRHAGQIATLVRVTAESRD